MKNKQYDQYFGFTEEETKTLLEYYGLSLSEEVKAMYDGYHIGNQSIYNPWSIINYADNDSLQTYWVNTSENNMIKEAMKKRDETFDRDYEQLITTEAVETTVYMETSFFEVSNTASLWGLFVNAGYMTIVDEVSSIDQIYKLKIPNQEVQDEFKKLTAYYLNVNASNLNVMFNALKLAKMDDFRDKYQAMLLQLPFYHDL